MKCKEIKIGQLKFANPVFGASGCVGHGYELQDYTDISRVGALSMKTVTYDPRIGNKPPRICEVPNGMMTSIGLQNPGAKKYIEEYLPEIKKAMRPDQIIISVGGNDTEDYLRTVDMFLETCTEDDIAAIELNGACPNVKHGGGVMSASADAMYELIKVVKKHTDIPLIGKMNTNFQNFCDVAKGIEAAGAEAVYLVSTPMGLRIDIKRRKPMIGNVVAPVNGPAVFPQSVLKTWNVYKSVNIPVIASGGIYTAEDAVEIMMAGAAAVGIGSAQFINPNAMNEILAGLVQFCDDNGIDSFAELTGSVQI